MQSESATGVNPDINAALLPHMRTIISKMDGLVAHARKMYDDGADVKKCRECVFWAGVAISVMCSAVSIIGDKGLLVCAERVVEDLLALASEFYDPAEYIQSIKKEADKRMGEFDLSNYRAFH